jgi:toluene monooxygenase system ferredoxin subunit
MAFERAAGVDDVWIGEMVGVVVAGARVLLVNVDGEIRAFEDRCAHRAFPLSQGRLDRELLTCAAHEWTYDARTGESTNPRGARLRRYAVRVEGEAVFVDVEVAP